MEAYLIDDTSDGSASFRASKLGFTLVEVAFSLLIFLMMILVFGAVFPGIVKTSTFSNNYQQATLIAQHKIDQVRKISFSGLDMTTPAGKSAIVAELASQGLIDNGTCSQIGSGNSVTCSFATVDGVVTSGTVNGYFPAGSTATVSVQPDVYAMNGTVFNIIVSLVWTGSSVSSGGYTAVAKTIELVHT